MPFPLLRRLLPLLLLLCSRPLLAQTDSLPVSAPLPAELDEFTVRAFEGGTTPLRAAAAVSPVSQATLRRFGTGSLVPALNTAPGVRAEERSPGSYRLSIRGSALRSPFGVRNVKVYYDGIPFTEPGGQTYLAQIGYYNVNSIEVLKGPAGSVYGAGTGGALLIRSGADSFRRGLGLAYSGGSYGLHTGMIELRSGTDSLNSTLRYQHLQQSGYREQSSLRRHVVSWDARARTGRGGVLDAHFFYADLAYGTPGGLTAGEAQSNPRAARPRSGPNPSAAEAAAAIYQQTFFGGVVHRQQLAGGLQNTTALYGAFTRLRNPAIRNYASSTEPSFGGRTVFRYLRPLSANLQLDLAGGAEAQAGLVSTSVFRNRGGQADTLQSSGDQQLRQGFVFVQAALQAPAWTLTAGLSYNKARVQLQQRYPALVAGSDVRNFNGELAPRLAAVYRVAGGWALFAAVSRGFSPPSLAELAPTGSAVNPSLRAEQGWNYEGALRFRSGDGRLALEAGYFHFALSEAIVQRRDAAGGDYYTNAGGTRQQGLEASGRWQLGGGRRAGAELWASYTAYHFRYRSFRQQGEDFSGKSLPGAAPHSLAGGLDLRLPAGCYLNGTAFYSSAIFLNDANTARADAYLLLGLRAGWRLQAAPWLGAELFIAADNLLNRRYSLGNDINAAGGRYFNPAPGRNFSAGLALDFH